MLITANDSLIPFLENLIFDPDNSDNAEIGEEGFRFLKKSLKLRSVKKVVAMFTGPGFWEAADSIEVVDGRRFLASRLNWCVCVAPLMPGYKLSLRPELKVYIASAATILCSAVAQGANCPRTARVILDNGEHKYDGFSTWLCHHCYAEAIEQTYAPEADASAVPPTMLWRSRNERN